MMNRVSVSDYNQLRREAQTRWLKPAEIYYILQNHENYSIAQEAPKKPPSGSLFLFNRRVLRFFRKDGHSWRKKRDGRAVGEAHERLKVGNVDALNCYYAHGEQNPYFQRRSYWMLDPAYEHIVLVHYREVAEGRFISSSISNMSLESSSTLNQSSDLNNVQFQGNTYECSELYEQNRCSCSPGSAEEVSSKFVIENYETNYLNIMNGSGTSDLSPQPEVNQALRKLTEQLSLDDDENTIYFGEKLPACSTDIETSQASGPEYLQHCQIGQPGNLDGYNSIQSHKVSGASGEQGSNSLGSDTGFERTQSLSWTDMLEISSDSAGINAHGMNLLAPEGIPKSSNSRAVVADFPASNMLKHGNEILAPSSEKEKVSAIPFGQAEQLIWEKLDNVRNNTGNGHIRYHAPESDLSLQLSATRRFLLGSDDPIESPTPILQLQEAAIHHTSGSTREVNSNAVSLQKENSADWMGTIDLGVVNSACRSSLSGMWFNQGQYDISSVVDSSLTVAQKQRFTIREISPEWAFPFERTKVIITGDFLCDPLECRWAIMFGDIEVPVEIVQQGVLRCQTPQHSAGKVTLCITSGNRESCSELREFEFRATPNEHTSTRTDPDHATKSSEEMLLLTKLAYMLLCGVDALSISKNCSETGSEHFVKSRTGDDEWSQIIEALVVGCENPSGTMEWILQELLQDKLKQWLSSKYQCNEGEGCLLTKQEQGIIHLISGLGYEFALNPILDSRVGINFRDANGWTALHWAARFGREEMVAALLAAGASAGAVTDPTPQDPVGKTPGAISAAYGHRGLAGYLSEVDLTSHLSSLTMEESELSKGSAEVEAERAVESISCRSVHVGGTEDELSLKDSLAAVRNTAQAAARIQAAFRAHSFRRRQQMFATNQDEYGLTAEDIRGLSISSKFQRAVHGSRDQKFDIAALAIQKKYRGWKGRKDFLTLRKHVVKIQAHVRGHQERKKYMEFLWTVSVVEKVVLRWRRKGVGLRGFRAEPELIDEGEEEVEDIVKVFRKQKVDAAIDQAVSRVLTMVDSPDARQQYRRMLERYRQAKVLADLSTVDEAAPRLQDDYEIIESVDFMY